MNYKLNCYRSKKEIAYNGLDGDENDDEGMFYILFKMIYILYHIFSSNLLNGLCFLDFKPSHKSRYTKDHDSPKVNSDNNTHRIRFIHKFLVIIQS